MAGWKFCKKPPANIAISTVAGEIQRASGTQLSPRVVDAFMELVNEGAFDNE